MKKTFFDYVMISFFNLLEKKNSNESINLSHICLTLYFLQTLSPLFSIHYKFFSISQNVVLSKLIHYSNYSALLKIVKSDILFFVFYMIALILVLLPFLFVIVYSSLRYYLKIKEINLAKFYNFIQFFIYCYNCIFILPLLNVFVHSLDCEMNPFQSEYFECDSFPFLNTAFYIFSVLGILGANFIGIIVIYVNKNYDFLFRSLNYEMNFISILLYFSRVLQIILYPIIKDKFFYYYLCLHSFGILSFLEYYHYAYIRNNSLKRVYLGLLFGFECILLIMTFWNYIGIVDNENLFYFIVILSMISFKLGLKLSEVRINHELMVVGTDIHHFDESLSNIRSDYYNNSNEIYVMGYFLNQLKHKSDKNYEDFKDMFNDRGKVTKIIDKFMKMKIQMNIDSKFLKNDSKRKNQLVFKYIDFLLLSSSNSLMIVYNYEEIKSKIKINSWFIDSYIKWLNRHIKKKCLEFQDIKEQNNEEYIEVTDYFKFAKNKRKFHNLIFQILLEKKDFWNNYLSGNFKQMETLIESLGKLNEKIESFEEKLEMYSEKTPSKILTFKLFSILYCLFYNNIDKALKFENDFDSLFNKERITIDEIVSKVSFFNKEIITCDVSYGKLDGRIKEKSKTEKFGNFFGYSKNELINVSLISQLMPDYIGKFHNQFVDNYININRSGDNCRNKCVQSYALHKNNYIFPITLYLGISYSYTDDFVLMAAIIPDKIHDDMILLFNEIGEICGISFTMMNFFKRKLKNSYLIDNLDSFTIFDLVADLEIISDSNLINNETVRNKKSIFSLPLFENETNLNVTRIIKSRIKKSLVTTTYKKFEISYDLNVHNYYYSEKKTIRIFILAIKEVSKLLKKDKTINPLTLFFDEDSKEENLSNLKNQEFYSKKNLQENLQIQIQLPDIKIKKNKEDRSQEKLQEIIEDNQENIIKSKKTNKLEKPHDYDTLIKQKNRSSLISKENVKEIEILFKKSNYLQENDKNSLKQEDLENIIITERDLEPNRKREEPKFFLASLNNQIPEISRINLTEGNQQEDHKPQMKYSRDIKDEKKEEEVKFENTISNKGETMLMEVFSKNSSVIKIKSQNFRIFKIIDRIKRHIPKAFYLLFAFIAIEILLAVIFAIIFQLLENNYFENQYKLTKIGMINFSQLYSSFSIATDLLIEFEYQKLNLTSNNPFITGNDIYHRILNDTFYDAKAILYSERNSPPLLNYQLIYRNYQTFIIDFDSNPKTLQQVNFFGLLDFYLTYLQYIKNASKNLEKINYDFLIFLQRNFPYYLNPSAAIFGEIQESSTFYNQQTTLNLMNVLIVFIIFMLCMKFLEMAQLSLLHSYSLRLLAIFLRTRTKEVYKEILLLDQIIDEFKEKKEDYLSICYVGKCIESQQNLKDFDFIGDISLQKTNQFKNKSKKINSSTNNIKPLTQTKNFILLFAKTVLSFCLFFFNFYFWLVVNSSIQNLISVNKSFSSICVYSSSLLTCNDIVIRERIISNNPSYEEIFQDQYQDKTIRINYLLSSFNQRFPLVSNVANSILINQILQAENNIEDPDFYQLIHSDICQLLLKLGKIQNDEALLCQKVWDGSLTKGLLIGLNRYILELTDLGNLRNTTNRTEEQAKEIRDYIASETHSFLFMGNYYLNLALYLFYDYINEYYDSIIENNIYLLRVILVFTIMIFSLSNMLIMIFIWRESKKKFKILGFSLSLMPYEKITDDETTFQIINNFLKNH